MFRSLQEQQAQQQAEWKRRAEQSSNLTHLCSIIKDRLIVKKDTSVTVSDKFLNALGMNDVARELLAREMYNNYFRMKVIYDTYSSTSNQLMAVRYVDKSFDFKVLIEPWFAMLKQLLQQDNTEAKYQIVLEGLNQIRSNMKHEPVAFNDVSEGEIDKDSLREVIKFIKRQENAEDSSEESDNEEDSATDKPSIVSIVNHEYKKAVNEAANNFTADLVKMAMSNDNRDPKYIEQLMQAFSDLGCIEDEKQNTLTMSY